MRTAKQIVKLAQIKAEKYNTLKVKINGLEMLKKQLRTEIMETIYLLRDKELEQYKKEIDQIIINL